MSSYRLTILVVDDEAALSEAIADVLRVDGHIVMTARDGLEALHLVTRMRFHLVIADLVMPGLRGDELLKHLGERAGGGCGRVIMSSLPETVVQQHAAEYDWYVAKPISLERLDWIVEECARRASASNQARDQRPLPN